MRKDLLGEIHRARRRVLKIVYHEQRFQMWTGVCMISDGIQRRALCKLENSSTSWRIDIKIPVVTYMYIKFRNIA
jgi:hypothetical protein